MVCVTGFQNFNMKGGDLENCNVLLEFQHDRVCVTAFQNFNLTGGDLENWNVILKFQHYGM